MGFSKGLQEMSDKHERLFQIFLLISIAVLIGLLLDGGRVSVELIK